LQEFIGHRFFRIGEVSCPGALPIVQGATYCHRETIGICNYTQWRPCRIGSRICVKRFGLRSARLQASIVDSSRCPPEGGRYKDFVGLPAERSEV
jgi:hypothetical protein